MVVLAVLGHFTYFGRSEVDLRLKRYDKALQNLFESGIKREESLDGITVRENGTTRSANDFEACMSLIHEHKLHRVGVLENHSIESSTVEILFSNRTLISP